MKELIKKLKKKAQESRNDMLIWYITCFIAVIAITGMLYSLGFIGKTSYHSSIVESNKITAAAVAVPEEPPEDLSILLNNTDNSTKNSSQPNSDNK